MIMITPEEIMSTADYVSAYVIGYKMGLKGISTQMPHCIIHKMIMQYYSSPYDCGLNCPYAYYDQCYMDLDKYLR